MIYLDFTSWKGSTDGGGGESSHDGCPVPLSLLLPLTEMTP